MRFCLEKLVNINDETNSLYSILSSINWNSNRMEKHQIFSPATARFIEKIKHSLKA